MRLIGTLQNEDEAKRLQNYLYQEQIHCQIEPDYTPSNNAISYQVWIVEEDKIEKAEKIFQEFQNNSQDPKFNAPEPEPEPVAPNLEELAPQEPLKQFSTFFTYLVIALCMMVFFIDTMEEISVEKETKGKAGWLLTPIQGLLMYDLPPPFEKLIQTIQRYELSGKTIQSIPQPLQKQIEAANNASFWQGFYNLVVLKMKNEDPSKGEGPLFVKIRQGELWRLISPCILHKDLLHILFNMLWLWYLGRPIEERIGPFRTLTLSLAGGLGTNLIQYLMSGPFFIGYSGIVTTLAGFTWMREKKAPWEGYPMNRATLFFLAFFILAILGLQIASFFIQVFTSYSFNPNIANAAHISGLLIGAFLGRFSFFAKRIPK